MSLYSPNIPLRFFRKSFAFSTTSWEKVVSEKLISCYALIEACHLSYNRGKPCLFATIHKEEDTVLTSTKDKVICKTVSPLTDILSVYLRTTRLFCLHYN